MISQATAERLWLKFFPHLKREIGVALVADLIRIHYSKKK